MVVDAHQIRHRLRTDDLAQSSDSDLEDRGCSSRAAYSSHAVHATKMVKSGECERHRLIRDVGSVFFISGRDVSASRFLRLGEGTLRCRAGLYGLSPCLDSGE